MWIITAQNEDQCIYWTGECFTPKERHAFQFDTLAAALAGIAYLEHSGWTRFCQSITLERR